MNRTVKRLLIAMALLAALLALPHLLSGEAHAARMPGETRPAPDSEEARKAAEAAEKKAAEDKAAKEKADAEKDDGDEDEKEPEEEENGPGLPWGMILPIGAIVLLFIWMSRKPKKEEQRRKEMLSNLKKGDKITTIGGIVGTVMEVREEEVTVKVDESSNTRMRFAKWAVRVPKPVAGDPAQSQEKSKEGS